MQCTQRPQVWPVCSLSGLPCTCVKYSCTYLIGCSCNKPLFTALKCAACTVPELKLGICVCSSLHNLLTGSKVLDLGCSPGAWLQVSCQEIGPRERGGLVLGVDLQPVQVPEKYCDDRVHVMQADARTLRPEDFTEHTPDVSAMACHCDGRPAP